MKISTEDLLRNFTQIYGNQVDIETYFAPENINILGFYHKNHGAKSLSFKIDRGNYLMLSKRDDHDFRVAASIDEQRFVFDVGNSRPLPEDKWINYPRSFIWTLVQKGYKLPCGLNLYFDTDFPSACFSPSSLLMLSAKALNDVYKLGISEEKLLEFVLELASEYFENFVSEQEIKIANLDTQNSFIYLDNKKIGLLDSHSSNYGFLINYIPNKVSDSVFYRKKVEDGFETLELLAKKLGLSSFNQLDPDLFEKQKHQITDKVLQKRAWFIIYELQRCTLAADFLKKSDFKAFGQLLNQSEVSMQRDFEQQDSGSDYFINIAWKQLELYGLKSATYSMTQAITLCIVPKATEEDFISKIESQVLASGNKKIYLFTPKIEAKIRRI